MALDARDQPAAGAPDGTQALVPPVRLPGRAVGPVGYAAITIAIGIMVAVAAASVWLSAGNRAGLASAEHGQALQLAISRLRNAVDDAETGQRGFLLSGRQEYLQPFRAALASMPGQLAILQKDLAGDSTLRDLADAITEKTAELRKTVEFASHGDRDAAIAELLTDRGKVLMDNIRADTATLGGEQQARQAKVMRTINDRGRWLVIIDSAGLVAMLLLAAWVTYGLRRYVLALREARQALSTANERLATANETLETTVALRTADLREANEEIQRFAYIVSHDLRAPLVNIMGFTGELEAALVRLGGFVGEIAARYPEVVPDEVAEAANDDLPEAIRFIKASTAKMDRLIGAILKLSREGRRVLAPERLDMGAVLTGIADTLRHQTEESGAAIEIGPLPELVGDRVAIEQIFGNLLENAVKYLDPARPGRISVTARRLGPMAEFAIADNGRGIAERDHERIFELFRRAGDQTVAGEGIGLAHVRALARRLGGTIDCQSTLGVGSTFRLRLPLSDRRRGGPPHERNTRDHPAGRGRPRPRAADREERPPRRRKQRDHPVPRRHQHAEIPVRRRHRPGPHGATSGAGAARSQPARHERHRHPRPHQVGRATPSHAGDRAHHHGRQGRDPALLRSRLQRLHHQAGGLRELRNRDPPARAVPHGDAGPRARMTSGVTMREGLAGIHVLYIDDDPGTARLVQRHLQRVGCAVTLAGNGTDGLARATETRFDAIALDHYMPGRDGLDVLASLRALPDPPPVIFVTAAEEPRVAVTALKEGAADYVVKDVQGAFLPTLATAIRHAIDRAALHRAKEEAEREVRELRDRLEKLAAQQAVLLREVNHRVANSLQLISSLIELQGRRAAAPEAREMLQRAAERVEAVSLVHRRLYTSNDVQFVEMDHYLAGLVEELRRATDAGETGHSIELTAEPMRVETDKAVPIGLIVNELVTNALKYAYPTGKGGSIRVALTRTGTDALRLVVEDDGIGLPDQPQTTRGSGLGSTIVSAMAKSVRAAVALDRTHPGTRFVVDVAP